MVIIGAVGAGLMLAAMGMISVVSLICYIKTSHVWAAVLFISSVVASATFLARGIYPYLSRNRTIQPGVLTWQDTLSMEILNGITGISMFVFAVALWRLLRKVVPQGEVA